MAKTFTFAEACSFLVRRLIRTAYDMPAGSVRPANQEALTGKPGDEFATVHIINNQAVDFQFSRTYANDQTAGSTQVVESVDGVYEFTASIQFFRSAATPLDGAGAAKFGMGAFDKASRLEAVLALSPNLDLMDSMGLCLEDVSPARNLSALVNGAAWEDRGSVDVTFNIVNRESVLMASFATAEIDVQLQRQGGQIFHETIEVTP